jgi:hypothetical protein
MARPRPRARSATARSRTCRPRTKRTACSPPSCPGEISRAPSRAHRARRFVRARKGSGRSTAGSASQEPCEPKPSSRGARHRSAPGRAKLLMSTSISPLPASLRRAAFRSRVACNARRITDGLPMRSESSCPRAGRARRPCHRACLRRACSSISFRSARRSSHASADRMDSSRSTRRAAEGDSEADPACPAGFRVVPLPWFVTRSPAARSKPPPRRGRCRRAFALNRCRARPGRGARAGSIHWRSRGAFARLRAQLLHL